MTAQALEQSVLESKDKTQLIQIAEALGVKANSRTKKAELIDQILAKTGPTSGSANGGSTSRFKYIKCAEIVYHCGLNRVFYRFRH